MITYALIAAALGIQAGIMVLWQVRSNRSLLAGVVSGLMPVGIVATSLAVVYTVIIALMDLLSQPYDPPERRPNATKAASKNKAIGPGAGSWPRIW